MANLEQGTKTATISSAGSLSGSVSCGAPRSLIGLITPSAWTAAAISFDVSMDDSTFVALYDDTGTEVFIPSASIATGAARAFALDPADFAAWKYIKVRSGLNGSVVAQGADRAVTLVFREVG